MKNVLTQLKNGQKVAMTAAEKQSMRTHLETLVGSTGTASHASASKIVTDISAQKVSPYARNAFGLNLFVRAAAFVLVGFIIGGTSLAFASTNALPGDTLYPIKTKVVEAVLRDLSFSPESAADYNATLVQTRIAELQTLKDDGKLSDPAVAAVAENSMTVTFSDYTNSLQTLEDQGRTARATEMAQGTLAMLGSSATAEAPVMAASAVAPAARPMMMMKSEVLAAAPQPSFGNSSIESKLQSLSSQLEKLSSAGSNSEPQQENIVPVNQTTNPSDLNQALPDTTAIDVQSLKTSDGTVITPIPAIVPPPAPVENDNIKTPLINSVLPIKAAVDSRSATEIQVP